MPWSFVQRFPHAAQLLLLPSAVSQPEPAPQSPKPAAQPMSVQVPVMHDAVAFGNEHGMSQPPQSVRLVVGVSQPSFRLSLQSPQPIEQVGTQPSAVQACVPCSFEQSAQPRQLSRVPSCVSQPSCAAEQSAKPAEQPVNSHMPPRHSPLPFGTKHELSQRPQ